VNRNKALLQIGKSIETARKLRCYTQAEPAAKQLVNEMVESIEKTWEITFSDAGVSNDVIDSVR